MVHNIKQIVRRLIVGNKLVLNQVNFFIRKKNENRYFNRIKNCSSKGLFDVLGVAAEFPIYPVDFVFDNQLYGLGRNFKMYAKTKKPISTYIEHGLFFGDHVQFDEFDYFSNKIITFSDVRKNHLINLGCKKEIVPIGPYIKYSEPFLENEKFDILKRELGNVLLVFPPHSTKNLKASYKLIDFIKKIKEVGKEFDTVLICMYWADVANDDLVKMFNENNFVISTAGHKFNPLFLNRLKTLIELSDMTMSGGVGTHIGYCISMNKPHYIINSKNEYLPKNKSGQAYIDKVSVNKIREDEIKEVESLFLKYDNSISYDQYNIINKYWGLDINLTADQMRRALYDKL